MSDVLITGASGFIGGWLARRFADDGATVAGVDIRAAAPAHPARPTFAAFDRIDVAEPEAFAGVLRRRAPSLIIHAAGPASVEASLRDPLGDLKAQIAPLAAVLDTMRRLSSRARLLLISSAAVYGDPTRLPVHESDPRAPVSPYGWHKLMLETMVEEFAQAYGLATCRARIFSTFGPGLRQLAVWDIAARAMKGDLSVRGTGEEGRDYLYIEDVAQAVARICVAGPFDNGVVNVAGGESIPILDLASRIHARINGACATIATAGRSERGKPALWRADVTRLRTLGFAPRYSLDDGLARTLDWIADAHAPDWQEADAIR